MLTADNALLQGVTTLAEGNDGSSPLPVGEHLQRVAETEISPNWAVFVGHGTVRNAVIGRDDRDLTAAELDQMKALLDTAMLEGALGLSTGLFYVPGAFSSTEECQGRSKIRPPWRRKTRPLGSWVEWQNAAVRRGRQDAGVAAGWRAFLLCSRR